MFLHKFLIIILGLLVVAFVESGAKILLRWLQTLSLPTRGISIRLRISSILAAIGNERVVCAARVFVIPGA